MMGEPKYKLKVVRGPVTIEVSGETPAFVEKWFKDLREKHL